MIDDTTGLLTRLDSTENELATTLTDVEVHDTLPASTFTGMGRLPPRHRTRPIHSPHSDNVARSSAPSRRLSNTASRSSTRWQTAPIPNPPVLS
ncbi:hypothetical protein GS592_25725 [Rhodococcus hoagii]|nr:hypothetical protein [Prescottella equi]